MKRLTGILMTALLLGACAPKADDAASIKTRGGNDSRARELRGSSGSGSVGGVKLNGAVFSDASNQEDFATSVRGLMEMVIAEDQIGYVSSQPDDETGLYVGVKVALEGGARVKNGMANAYASSKSKLVIAVYDRFEDGDVPNLPAMEFKLTDGYVSGNQAVLEFQQIDRDGRKINNYIRLEGSINGQFFVARMHYDVQDMWDGSGEGHYGHFDYLNVPTCDIFACN